MPNRPKSCASVKEMKRTKELWIMDNYGSGRLKYKISAINTCPC